VAKATTEVIDRTRRRWTPQETLKGAKINEGEERQKYVGGKWVKKEGSQEFPPNLNLLHTMYV
jgi:hypothetical protein